MNTNGNNYTNGHSGGLNSLGVSRESNSGNELIDTKWLLAILKRYVWLILICALVGVGVAYYLAYEYYLPIYRSESTVLILGSPDNFPGSNEIGKIISSSYNLNAGASIQSEIHFLKSRELSNEVAQQVLQAKFLPDSSIYPVLWADYPEDSTIVSQETVAGRIRSGLKVQPIEQGSNILSVSFESYAPHEAARIVNFSVNTYKEITAQKKRESAKSALVYLDNKQKEIKSDLDQAENKLSGFKNNQNLVSIESQTSNMVSATSALQAQRAEISVQLEAVRSNLDNYEKQMEAIKPGLGEKNSQAVAPTIKSYQAEIAQLNNQRLILISNNPQLKDHPESEPQLVKIDRQRKDLQNEIKRLTNKMVSSSNSSLGLMASSSGDVTQELSGIQTQITKLKIEESQYEAQLKAINGRLQNNQSFLSKVPDNQKQLERFKREVAVNEQLYLSVSGQANEVRIWEQTRSGAGTVIDYGRVSNIPVKPQKILWLVMGLIIGMMLPIGFVFSKEVLNNKINTIKDLSNKKYPLLAVIYNHALLDVKKTRDMFKSSYGKSKKISNDLILYHYGLSPIAESYRDVVTKILYSNPDNPAQTLLITSPGASEGKTTLTANMATALTETGNSVLIIDCDMRKPGIPKFFGVSKEKGIMDILFKKLSPEDAIKDTPIPGLHLLNTGKKQPARPTSVLGSDAFKKLLEKFKREYDFVLLDSAPFGIIGDVAPIIHLTDGVIVTSRFLQTKHSELDHTIKQLEDNSANILGLTLSSYDPKKSIDNAETRDLYNNKYKSYYNYYEKQKDEKKDYGKIT